MNRSHFLQRNATVLSAPAVAVAVSAAIGPQAPPETVSRYANKALPTGLSRATSTLGPYTGPWGPAQAAHLLRRSLFGPTRTQVATAATAGLTPVLNGLLTAPAAPAPPLNVSATDTSVAMGQPWFGQVFD